MSNGNYDHRLSVRGSRNDEKRDEIDDWSLSKWLEEDDIRILTKNNGDTRGYGKSFNFYRVEERGSSEKKCEENNDWSQSDWEEDDDISVMANNCGERHRKLCETLMKFGILENRDSSMECKAPMKQDLQKINRNQTTISETSRVNVDDRLGDGLLPTPSDPKEIEKRWQAFEKLWNLPNFRHARSHVNCTGQQKKYSRFNKNPRYH